MKKSKTCLVILCLLSIRTVGLPQSDGANFFMKEIELSQGKIAFVDDEDFDYLNQFKWCAVKTKASYGILWYAIRNTPWIKIDGIWRHSTIRMHRLILDVTDKSIFVDHADKNGINNQKNNLRICSNRSDNLANRNVSAGKTSKYLGVSFHKGTHKWRSRICRNGINHDLGYFINESDAALAYNNAAVKIHGQFASLNII